MNGLLPQGPSITSREIADLVNLRHDNVKRTIETLVAQGVITSPQSEEIPTATRRALVFVFSGEQGKRDSIVVVAQLSPGFTAKLVDRWLELEQRQAWHGTARRGSAWQAWLGLARLGVVRHGTTRQATRGWARNGKTRQATQGMDRPRKASPGTTRHGTEGPGNRALYFVAMAGRMFWPISGDRGRQDEHFHGHCARRRGRGCW